MNGRDCFTSDEAAQIRQLLDRIRKAERDDQKRGRSQLRRIGFFITDWPPVPGGFASSDFDALVLRRLIQICDSPK